MCTVHSEEGLRPKRCVTKINLVKKCSPTHFAPSILPIRSRLPMHSAPLYEILPIPLSNPKEVILPLLVHTGLGLGKTLTLE